MRGNVCFDFFFLSRDYNIYIANGHWTVMQIEKELINDRLRVSKVSRKFRIATISNFKVIYL